MTICRECRFLGDEIGLKFKDDINKKPYCWSLEVQTTDYVKGDSLPGDPYQINGGGACHYYVPIVVLQTNKGEQLSLAYE